MKGEDNSELLGSALYVRQFLIGMCVFCDRNLRVLAHRKYRRPRSCPHLIDHIFGARINGV